MFPFYYIKMSQVILKLAKGDKVDSNKTENNFVYWGDQQYQYKDFEDAIKSNDFDGYLQSQGIEGKDADEIRGYLNSYIQGFKEGKIRRNAAGNYDVSDESLITDKSPAKRGLFGKIRGDKKRIALAYFNRVFDSLPRPGSTSNINSSPEKQAFTYGYGKQLRRNIFKDDNESDAEREIWYANENKWDTALNALNAYRDSLTGDYDFSSTSFKDKNEYLNALAEIESALRAKNLDSLKQSLYNAGEADLYSLFMNKADYDYSKLTPEQKQTAEEQARLKAQQLEDELGEMTESERLAEEDSPEYLAKMEELERRQEAERQQAEKQKELTNIRALFNELPISGNSEPWTPDHKHIRLREPLKIGNWIIPGQPKIEKGSLQDKRIEATNAVASKIGNWFLDFFTKGGEKPQYYYKDGGILKAQGGNVIYNPTTKNIRNTSMNSSYNRERDLLGAEETLNYLKGIDKDNYVQFNGYEDLYDSNYIGTYGEGSLNNWGTQTLNNLKFDPRTKNMQFVWNSRGLNNPIFKGFTGVGNSGDRPNLSGVNPLNGSSSRNIFKKVDETSGNEIDPAKIPNFRLSSENIGDLRFGITQWFNNRQKYNPQVPLTDAPTLYSKVQYNLPMEVFYQNAANKFRRLGARTATADQTINFARQLESESKANELEEKGRLANLDTYAKTTQRAQEVQNTNTLARVQNANQNKVRMVSAQEAKAAFERAKDLKRGQNLTNWLFGKQQSVLQREQAQKGIEEQILRDRLSTQWENDYKNAQVALENARKAYKPVDNTPWEASNDYKIALEKYNNDLKEARRRGQKELWKEQSRLYGTGLFKKGGSLSFGERVALQDIREYNKKLLQDKKEFNKLLRLSITEGNKTIRGISNYSASLIKNSLKL